MVAGRGIRDLSEELTGLDVEVVPLCACLRLPGLYLPARLAGDGGRQCGTRKGMVAGSANGKRLAWNITEVDAR